MNIVGMQSDQVVKYLFRSPPYQIPFLAEHSGGSGNRGNFCQKNCMFSSFRTAAHGKRRDVSKKGRRFICVVVLLAVAG